MVTFKSLFNNNQLISENTHFLAISPKYQKKYKYHDTFSYIFHKNRTLIVYKVTRDDNVYVFDVPCELENHIGNETKSCLFEFKKVEELSHIQVINIIFGVNFTLALTKNGNLYSWGWNKCGQLGHGNKLNSSKPIIIESFLNKFVVDIKCGLNYCIALTRNGEVYEWGENHVINENILSPSYVIGLKNEIIIAISCGVSHTVALTDNGEVYCWGLNTCGQLGVGSFVNQPYPTKLALHKEEKICKINCGSFNSMLLSFNGDIYLFGSNEFSRLEQKNYHLTNIPNKIDVGINFINIDTTGFYSYELSIGQSKEGSIYVWGEFGPNYYFSEPTKTVLKNIDEIHIECSNYKTYYFAKAFANMTPSERMIERFDKKEFKCNDITFEIEGKFIYTSKGYLRTVCKHFEILFSRFTNEHSTGTFVIKNVSYFVFYSFLKYLYTNIVDLHSRDIVELYYLGVKYNDFYLRHLCIQVIKDVLSINNVIKFWSFAVEMNLKELEKEMFDFIKINFKDVIGTYDYINRNDGIKI